MGAEGCRSSIIFCIYFLLIRGGRPCLSWFFSPSWGIFSSPLDLEITATRLDDFKIEQPELLTDCQVWILIHFFKNAVGFYGQVGMRSIVHMHLDPGFGSSFVLAHLCLFLPLWCPRTQALFSCLSLQRGLGNRFL